MCKESYVQKTVWNPTQAERFLRGESMGICRGISLPEETYIVFENGDGTYRLETKEEQTLRLRKSWAVQGKEVPEVLHTSA